MLPGPEKGAEPNYKNPRIEPVDHALGHSRGGWTTKSHVAVDASGRLRSVIVTPGQAGENPRLFDVLDATGTPVCRVVADKAYSHPSTRAALRARRIRFTSPERTDQKARRAAKGGAGGRLPAFDRQEYTRRNVVERCFNRLKQFRDLATRYAKRAAYYRCEILIAATILWLR